MSENLILCQSRAVLTQVVGAWTQDKTKTTLTMDDLSAALAEYGINSRKPEFYM